MIPNVNGRISHALHTKGDKVCSSSTAHMDDVADTYDFYANLEAIVKQRKRYQSSRQARFATQNDETTELAELFQANEKMYVYIFNLLQDVIDDIRAMKESRVPPVNQTSPPRTYSQFQSCPKTPPDSPPKASSPETIHRKELDEKCIEPLHQMSTKAPKRRISFCTPTAQPKMTAKQPGSRALTEAVRKTLNPAVTKQRQTAKHATPQTRRTIFPDLDKSIASPATFTQKMPSPEKQSKQPSTSGEKTKEPLCDGKQDPGIQESNSMFECNDALHLPQPCTERIKLKTTRLSDMTSLDDGNAIIIYSSSDNDSRSNAITQPPPTHNLHRGTTTKRNTENFVKPQLPAAHEAENNEATAEDRNGGRPSDKGSMKVDTGGLSSESLRMTSTNQATATSKQVETKRALSKTPHINPVEQSDKTLNAPHKKDTHYPMELSKSLARGSASSSAKANSMESEPGIVCRMKKRRRKRPRVTLDELCPEYLPGDDKGTEPSPSQPPEALVSPKRMLKSDLKSESRRSVQSALRFSRSTKTDNSPKPLGGALRFDGFRTPGEVHKAVQNVQESRRRKESYVAKETVRGKAREALQGFTCNECDAIITHEAKYSSDPEREHKRLSDKCCRHRAHKPPPMTPEGYWKLTFDETQTQPPSPPKAPKRESSS